MTNEISFLTQTCAQVTHYRNASKARDPVPRIDRKGAKREKDTIVNLVSHPTADFFDHPKFNI